MTDSLRVLLQKILRFRDERDWAQFHQPKDLALAAGIEAAELGELFLWKTPDEVQACLKDPAFREQLGDEIADVLVYLLLLAHEAGVDPAEAADRKLAKNAAKYPVEHARGRALKSTEFGLDG